MQLFLSIWYALIRWILLLSKWIIFAVKISRLNEPFLWDGGSTEWESQAKVSRFHNLTKLFFPVKTQSRTKSWLSTVTGSPSLNRINTQQGLKQTVKTLYIKDELTTGGERYHWERKKRVGSYSHVSKINWCDHH